MAVSSGYEGAGYSAGALCPLAGGGGLGQERLTLKQLLELPDPVLADHLFGHTPVQRPPAGPPRGRHPQPRQRREYS